MQNISTLCTAAGCWMTFDVNSGQWSVVVNEVASSIKSFDDSNIIGGINISGSGINELYNSVSVEFPHADLRDQTDYIDLKIPDEDRFPNELDNRLNISLDCINDPIQAQRIGTIELKQSRVDKIVEFRTDYSSIGLKAGDVIDITSDVYGYTNKLFRITRITEEDSDDGQLILSITGLEYSDNVYDTTGLIREERTKKTGIIPKSQNNALTSLDQNKTSSDSIAGLTPLLIATLLSKLASGIGGGGIPTFNTFTLTASPSEVQTAFNAYAGVTSFNAATFAGDNSSAVYLSFTLSSSIKTLVLFIQSPLASFGYQTKINGTVVSRSGFVAYAPCQIQLGRVVLGGVDVLNIATVDWQTSFSQIQLANAPAGQYIMKIEPLPTYDLDQQDTQFVYPYNYSVIPQGSGGGITVTAWGFNV